jgi:outer membrane protein
MKKAVVYILLACAVHSFSDGFAQNTPPADGGTVSTAQPVRKLTLDEAFALSLRRSETLAVSSAAVAEAEARIEELGSVVKPRVSFRASEIYQDKGDFVGSESASARRSRPQVNLNAHQSLFSGFREFLALKAARRQGESAALELRRAEDLLYLDVAQAYLNLLGVEKEIITRSSATAISQKRVQELQSRERLGRSRKSELLAAQAQLAQLEADIKRARGQEDVSQELLRFFTGVEEYIDPEDVVLPSAEALDSFLSRALSRPDVQARESDLMSEKLSVDISRRQRWPTIGLDANYYFKRPSGAQENIDWDTQLTLDLPLYTGGAVRADIRQAAASQSSAEQRLSLARRRAELEVRTAHRTLISSLGILEAFDKAAGLSEANAQAQQADYRLGLVTNLEVLESLNSLQNIRLRREQARLEAVLARVRLEVAAGTIGSGGSAR